MAETAEEKDPLRRYKIALTLVAVAIFAGRILFPHLNIDAVSLGLLVLAVLPWLSPLIKSAEIPGVGKIEFRDVRSAAEKIIGGEDWRAGIASSGTTNATEPSYIAVAAQDPRLALVGLRIELEKRLRTLADRAEIQTKGSLAAITRELEARAMLGPETGAGLRDLIRLGNDAAHGADVDADVAMSTVDFGPKILGILDGKLAELRSSER